MTYTNMTPGIFLARPNRFIAHVEVDGAMDVFRTHDTIDNIEKHLNRELGILATIHLDPIVADVPLLDEWQSTLLISIGQRNEDCTVVSNCYT